MATNPRFPEHDERQQRGPIPVAPGAPRPRRPGRGLWGLLLGIGAAILLLVTVLYWLPQAPKEQPSGAGATVPEQPTPGQLEMSSLQLAPAPIGNAVRITGQLMNTGAHPINGVQVRGVFYGANGEVVGTLNTNLAGVEIEDDPGKEVPLTERPIQPNETRAFRADFSNLPQNWNKQMPELQILTVTGFGEGDTAQQRP